jgi:SAM-dependent methyltransferase
LNLGSTVKVVPMTISNAPNHHADHPPFRGASGTLAALSMAVGRSGIARLASELIELGAEDRLVDVGCGPGAGVRLASRTAADVVGVDPAPVMLDVARRTVRRPNVRWLEGGAEDLPLAAGSATALWSLSAVHHWNDVDAGLAETVRVLVPGGRFVAIEGRIDPDASGHRSHGWTRAQADAFGDACGEAGLTRVRVVERTVGSRPVLAVVAVRPS